MPGPIMNIKISRRFDAKRIFESSAIDLAQSAAHKANELAILARLFERTGGNLPVDFPLSVELHEKPDFIFNVEGTRIGVEVTQFRPEQLARAEHIASNEKCGMVITPFNFGSQKRNNDEIRDRMHGQQVGLGDWVEISKQVEIHSNQMIEIIASKVKKVVVPNQQIFVENWLVIEDRMNISSYQVAHMMPRIRQGLYQQSGDLSFDLIILSLTGNVCGFYKGTQFSF